MPLEIRAMSPEDVPAVVALQRACFPAPFPEELLWKAEHLLEHLQRFSDGQFVATEGDAVVGSASSLIIGENNWQSHKDWETTVGGPFLRNHDCGGTTLYGVDISVHPSARGLGVGRLMYGARFSLVRQLGLTRYGTACRIPDFARSGKSEPEEYVHRVSNGELNDRTLTPLLRYGLKPIGVIHEYMDDEESGNAAALLEWTP